MSNVTSVIVSLELQRLNRQLEERDSPVVYRTDFRKGQNAHNKFRIYTLYPQGRRDLAVEGSSAEIAKVIRGLCGYLEISDR